MKFAKIRNYCEYHDIWYLKIPLDIPREIIKEVNDVYDNGFFVEHRYGDTAETGGWKSKECFLGYESAHFRYFPPRR